MVKRLLPCAVASVFAVSLFSFPRVSAAQQTTTLTSAQTVALFGNTIDCEYLSTDGTFHSVTATYSGYVNITEDHTYTEGGQSFYGRQFVQYAIPYQSDMDVTTARIMIQFQTAVDLSGIDYIDTGIVQLTNIDFSSALYGRYTDYWHCSSGNYYAARRGSSGTDYDLYGVINLNSGYPYTCIPVLYQSDSVGSFSTGYAYCGSFNDATYGGSYYIGIICPILSDSWTLSGNSGAGGDFGSSGDGSDSGSGTDLSGVTSRLDQIISLLDEIADNTANSSSADSSSVGDPTSIIQGFDSDVSAIDADLSYIGSFGSGLDEVSFVDAQYTEGYDELKNLFEISASESHQEDSAAAFESSLSNELSGVPNIFGQTMLTTTIIAALAFVIFGKRGV